MPKRRKKKDTNTFKHHLDCENKIRYGSETKALEAADFRMLENMSVTLLVYQCSVCQGWHLTRAKKEA